MLFEPATVFVLDSAVVQDVDCFGNQTGSISALPQGGDMPYQYLWSSTGAGNGATTQGITGLPTGNYLLTVTDDNGCQRMGAFFVDGPDASIGVTVLDSAGVVCFGDTDGFINIAVSGGTPGYIFNWNAISGQQNLSNAPAGDYTLVIFDSEGCPFTATYHLGTPPPLQLGVSANDQTQVAPPNGSATANASGGTPPIQYNWSNGMSGETITDLTSGQYSVTAVDANGCDIMDYVFVDFTSKTIDNQQVVPCVFFPNPTSGPVNLQCSSMASQAVDLRVFNQIGQLVLVKNAEPLQSDRLRFDLQDQPPGIYQVVALTSQGVVFEGKILVQR